MVNVGCDEVIMEQVNRLLDIVEDDTADLDQVSARIVSDKLAIDPASPDREAQERRIAEVEQLVFEQRQVLQREVEKALDPLGVEELEWLIRDAETVVESLVKQQREGWAKPPWLPPEEATDATWVIPTPDEHQEDLRRLRARQEMLQLRISGLIANRSRALT